MAASYAEVMSAVVLLQGVVAAMPGQSSEGRRSLNAFGLGISGPGRICRAAEDSGRLGRCRPGKTFLAAPPGPLRPVRKMQTDSPHAVTRSRCPWHLLARSSERFPQDTSRAGHAGDAEVRVRRRGVRGHLLSRL